MLPRGPKLVVEPPPLENPSLSTDNDDNFQTVSASDYHSDLTKEPALLWPDVDWPFTSAGWPQSLKGGPDTFRVTYVAGYANAAAVPAVIKHWILMRAAELYCTREGSKMGKGASEIQHFSRMLDAFRVR